MPSLLTDIDLWRSFKEGDKDAFGELFRRHYSVLIQYGTKLCPERAIVEDCIQELFTELWQNKPGVAVQSVKAYLLSAVKYKLYKLHRDNPAAKHVEELNGEGGFEIGHENFIISREEDNRKAASVLSALNQLPARQKEIIYLKIYQSLDYEEITEVMGINYQVARNLFSQSLKSLRNLLSATQS